MKVRELIQELEKFDPELRVVYCDTDYLCNVLNVAEQDEYGIREGREYAPTGNRIIVIE